MYSGGSFSLKAWGARRSRAMPAWFAKQYLDWIDAQKAKVPAAPKKRKETSEELLKRAKSAAKRIEQGIALLEEAFRIANRVMAAAGKRRLGPFKDKDPATIKPEWRP